MIKFCAFDIDGTLLNHEGNITDENRDALKALKKKGIMATLATGRSDLMVKSIARQLDIELPVISCNGAIIRDLRTAAVLLKVPMEQKACRSIMDICHTYGLPYQLFSLNCVYLNEEGRVQRQLVEWNEKHDPEDSISFEVIESPSDILKPGMEIFRIKVDIDEPSLKGVIESKVNELSGVFACFSEFNLLECVHRDASKGKALKYLSQMMSIPRDSVAAFGDSFNDISMFQYAGLSIAMGNADTKVKETANHVSLTNRESGVAHGIHSFLLK